MAQRVTDQLVGALQDFQGSLSSRQSQEFFADYNGTALKSTGAVHAFVAQIDSSPQRRPFRCLASRMEGTLRCVEQFSKIVDTFIPSRPPIGAQIWGTLRFAIELASHHASFFEILSDWFIGIQPFCPRLREYEFIHRDSFKLQEALCSFHAILVDFCANAVSTVGQCGVIQHSRNFWAPVKKNFEDFAELLQKRHTDIENEIAAAEDQASQRDYQLQLAERQKADESSKYPRVLRFRFDRLVEEDKAWKRHVEQRNAKSRKFELLDKLSDHDHSFAFNRERRKRYGCTANWLARSQHFQDWIADTESSTFWLSGLPGTGKTVMATSIIDSLLVRKGAFAVGVAYFFCQYNKPDTLQARTLLGSLIRQCLAEEHTPANQETYLDQILSSDSLNEHDMKAFFLKVLTESREQVLIIDGFDEMAFDQRSVVLEVLRHVSSAAEARVKTFISSRHDVGKEVEQALPKLTTRSMTGQFVIKDIITYIKLGLAEKVQSGNFSVTDSALLSIVEEMLVEKSTGNFLWAFLQLENLCAQKDDDAVYKVLAALPKDLPETFRQALRRILRNKKEGIAAMMFFWAAAARRPLTLLEMREIIAIHDGQKRLAESRFLTNVDNMVPWCGGLLELDEEERVVRFTHQSIRDYLFSLSTDSRLACFHFRIDRIDWDAGKACCTYLSLDDFVTPAVVQQQQPQQPLRSQSLPQPNVNGDGSIKAVNGESKKGMGGALARSRSTLGKVAKFKPSTLINALIILEEDYYNELEQYHQQRNQQDNKENHQPNQQNHENHQSPTPPPVQKPITPPPAPKPKEKHYFLNYARQNWLHHTATVRKDDAHYAAWRRLIFAKPEFAPKPWVWQDRAWSEPEDPDLLKVIVDLNHRALLDLIISTHHSQTHHLPSSPKFRSILTYLAQHAPPALFTHLLTTWADSSLPIPLWSTTLSAALAGGHLPTCDLLLRPDAWSTDPLHFPRELTRLAAFSTPTLPPANSIINGTPTDARAKHDSTQDPRAIILAAKANLKHAGPLSSLKLLMEMQARDTGEPVGFAELYEACRERDEGFVERILAVGVDPRGFPEREFGLIRGVMGEEGEEGGA